MRASIAPPKYFYYLENYFFKIDKGEATRPSTTAMIYYPQIITKRLFNLGIATLSTSFKQGTNTNNSYTIRAILAESPTTERD